MTEDSSYKIKKAAIIIFGVFIIVILAITLYWMIAMSQLPIDDGDLGNLEEEEVLPERPGTQSLILTGPIIKPLVFTIDMSKPNLRSLDWSALKDIDLTAIGDRPVGVYYDNQETGQWELMESEETSVSIKEGKLKIKNALIPHFSRYAVAYGR